MENFVKNLVSELEQKLKDDANLHVNFLKYAESAVLHSIHQLEKLKSFALRYKFVDKASEIAFFKIHKPALSSYLIYYSALYNLEINVPLGGLKCVKKFYIAELDKLHHFFADNSAFYRYYRAESCYNDELYFLRGKHENVATFDSFYFQADLRFCTSHDFKVALILANAKLKTYIEQKLSSLDAVKKSDVDGMGQQTLKWTGSKVGLIELIYALHTEGVLNYGRCELKQTVAYFEKIFDVEVGQFHRTFYEICSRKTERSKFLNSLKDNLLKRIDEADGM
ncbi:RteC domain-containing protein [Flavobacterium qiangtangense]|uniref:RteC domain-containing protein n=1 Tax=Flavobacterium qiangtangense TaxID=1442595 RepID=A0ABW1PJD8_9FLAO